MKLHSYTITQGRDRAPARAMLKAIGFTDEDLKKPIIGIANTWIETMPCNYNLRELAKFVKEGVRAAGGTPMEFNTVAISDGVTMGTEGMKASLVSRDLIADSIELVAAGHMFDGIVALVACDKTIPGAAMALLRLNVPSVVLYGGSILPGRHQGRDLTIQDVFEAVGANAAGHMSDAEMLAIENAACPGSGRVRRTIHGQHHGDRDGNDRARADEHGGGSAGRQAQGSRGRALRRSCDGRGARESQAARYRDA
jgi:dihydroxy-acid dehydratase